MSIFFQDEINLFMDNQILQYIDDQILLKSLTAKKVRARKIPVSDAKKLTPAI